jgi:dihydroneopterin aldolase
VSDSAADRVTVAVEGLEVFGYHGVHEAERELGQRFLVDVRIELSGCPGAATDRLEDTVDYARLTEDVAAIVAGPPFALIERLASEIAGRVLAEPLAAAAEVTVRKPHVALPSTVAATAVTLRRVRDE